MVTGEYPPQLGGVGDYTARLSEALVADGVPVAALTTRDGSSFEAGVQVIRAVPSWGPGSWSAVTAAARQLRTNVVHVQYQAGAFELKGAVHLLPLCLRLAAWRIPALGKLRIVTTFHDLRVPYLFPKAGPLRPAAVGLLLRTSHAAIFTDPADLATVGPGEHRYWIPIGSNITPTTLGEPGRTARAAAARRSLTVGFFGFLGPDKGAETLLRAIRLLANRGWRVRLVLVGAESGANNPTDRPTAASFWRLASELGVQNIVEGTGPLDASAVSARLLACDVLALPYRDGASFRRGTLMAALAHGRPIVTTQPSPSSAGDGPWKLEPERQFLAVPPGDPPALADAIERIARSPELARQLGDEARQLGDKLAWPALARRTREVYARLT
jgi:glycosyltransferase involved in cell wall biosynthesis